MIFLPGKKIINKGEYMDYIYFIEKGTVIIKDYFGDKKMIELTEGDYFGDYQVLLETRSNISYETPENEEVILFALYKSKFLEVSF